MSIGILEYGAGNIKNVCRALDYLGYQYALISKPEEVISASKLLIPGVGAFKVAMEQMAELSLIEPIREAANTNTEILGICLGMQLLFDHSSEFGESDGLGLIRGEVNHIPRVGLSGNKLKVPHIGWNELIVQRESSKMVEGVVTGDPVYYVHSYRAENLDPNTIVCSSVYDGIDLPGVVQKDNVFGCQFHPEKSGDLGLKILKNFLR